MASLKRSQGLALHRTQLIPASSATDPSQDKAKPICKVSGAHLTLMTQEGRRCSKCWSRDSPAARGENICGAGIPCSRWRGPCQNRVMFPEKTVACGGPTLEQVYPEGLQPVERTNAVVRKSVRWSGREELLHTDHNSPIAHPPALLGVWAGGSRPGKEGVKLGLERRERVKKM
ncbi:hypothetical protein llap_5647 [Limosa lapponica baueri]|uniref:Uncharacterized protein n=1 Tax=Limosa lapponica baueri TaxID=1758121 RepID=A0A2I0UDC9_LIMLA|nr:hypothetical protein llap_5647 [Limosa lapponica baueri]